MSKAKRPRKEDTTLAQAGRDPARYEGFVNTPIYRGSTVLYPTLDCLEKNAQAYSYGRLGTPTVTALQTMIAELEGGDATLLAPSGLSAISAALLAFVESGDHILVSDSVYRPTRRFCDNVLKRLGVTTTYYDPLIGAGIDALLTDNTRLVFTESPGSQTLEVQDIQPSRRSRTNAAPWSSWTTPGRRHSTSSHSRMGSMCRSRRRPSTSSGMPTRCWALSPPTRQRRPRWRGCTTSSACAPDRRMFIWVYGECGP
jgi:hypothetical protein